MAYSKSYETLIRESLNDLRANTNITQLVPGAKARALLENFNSRLAGAYQYFDNSLVNQFLSSATGDFLDLIGDLLSCPRLNATFANASVGAVNVKFFVSSGTFGDLNSSQNITVPAGTKITTSPPGTDPTQVITYQVSVNTSLIAANSEQFVPVEAMQPGTAGAVGSGTLVNHNLTAYLGSLQVTNVAPIANTRDRENDDAYRYRLSLKVTGAAMANATAVRLACLSVPGVADVNLKPFSMGGGTFEVIILPSQSDASQDMIDAAQAAINVTQSLGCYGVARSPNFIGLQFQANIYTTKTLSATDAALLQQQLSQSSRDYFTNFALSQDFLVNNFQAFLLNSSSQIRTIGKPGRPFLQISLWKPSRLNNGRKRYTLAGDYLAGYDEIIRLENQSGVTPAIFNILNP